MIDTGSSISAINASFLRALHIDQPIQSVTTTCRTANNGQLHILGKVDVPMRIAGAHLRIPMYVVDDLCANLLLGGDFCATYRVNLCYERKFLTLFANDERHQVSLLPQMTNRQVFNVTSSNAFSIPPLSAMVIRASTSAPAMSAIFEPCAKQLAPQQLLAPHAVLSIRSDRSTLLTVLNTTHTMQTIAKGTLLGKVRHHADHQCSYVHSLPVDQRPLSMATINSPSSGAPPSYTTHSLDPLLSHLSMPQQQALRPILLKHQQVFDSSTPTTMTTGGVGHRIPIPPHHQPIHSYPYRKSRKETEHINEQVQEMLANKIIRPSSSPWSSPVVIIQKKDGSPRFCVDYRRLNAITDRDVYPLPRIDDILDRLAGCQYFSTLDLKAGYWQLPIDERDKNKTAFVTTEGLYEFNVLPFGLSNAPASFQRIMNSVLGALRWDLALVYLDDIIIYSKSFAQHLHHVDLVLAALHKANVRLNLSKCSLARKQLDYLGFRITQDGIKPTTANVRKTLDFPIPTSAKAAYSFVQLAQFYRRFIKNFASIAAPLNVFKITDAQFVWTDACQQAFDELKRQLSQYPLLAFYDDRSALTLRINTDASNVGIGGVLHQVTPDGRLQPVQYLSRALSKREKRYSVIEKECLAMVWCISKLRPYVYGRDFTLITDHHPLCWLNKQSSKNGRLDRWSLQLQEYSFTIKHISGSSNCVADCLSRYPLQQLDDSVEDQIDVMHGQLNAILPTTDPSFFDATRIPDLQRSDPTLFRILAAIADSKPQASYCLQDDTLCRIVRRSHRQPLTLPVIPTSLVPNVLHAYHNHPLSGHLGIHKTWERLRDKYFWVGMFKDIKKYILACQKCRACKIDRTKPMGTLQPIEPPTGILELMGLDFVGPVPESTNGHKYILVCTDYLSRFAITQATRNCTADTAAKFLVEQVILRLGVPKQLLTDRGSHFMSRVFEAIAARCGTHHITTTSYHPQCNGLTERFNATLVDSLATYVNQQQSDWDAFLPYVTFAYNTAKQSTTGIEPFNLMYGRTAVLPFDTPAGITQLPTTNDYYAELLRFLQRARSIAWFRIKAQQNVYKRTYDTGRQELQPLKPGRLVFLKQMMPKNLRKFSAKYYGPFRVTRQLGRLNYEVQHTVDGRLEKVHVSRLRLIS